MDFRAIMETVGQTIDAAGVAAIVIGAFVATLRAAWDILRKSASDTYGSYRRRLGRSILLGLELLVAADIIRSVAISPTLDSVLVLALIVLIRTFLSFSLELEITGRWPWQKPGTDTTAHAAQPPSPGAAPRVANSHTQAT